MLAVAGEAGCPPDPGPGVPTRPAATALFALSQACLHKVPLSLHLAALLLVSGLLPSACACKQLSVSRYYESPDLVRAFRLEIWVASAAPGMRSICTRMRPGLMADQQLCLHQACRDRLQQLGMSALLEQLGELKDPDISSNCRRIQARKHGCMQIHACQWP